MAAAGQAIAKVHYTHEAMVDMIVANPAISQNQLAAHFGYSASWISQILSSDAFQTRLAERTKDMVDPVLRGTVEEQFKGLVGRSLELLREKLSAPAVAIPDNLVLRSLEISSRALGYGAREAAAPPPPADVHLHLEVLGERLTGLLQRKKAQSIIDGELINDAP